jgi:hypothetical protein
MRLLVPPRSWALRVGILLLSVSLLGACGSSADDHAGVSGYLKQLRPVIVDLYAEINPSWSLFNEEPPAADLFDGLRVARLDVVMPELSGRLRKLSPPADLTREQGHLLEAMAALSEPLPDTEDGRFTAFARRAAISEADQAATRLYAAAHSEPPAGLVNKRTLDLEHFVVTLDADCERFATALERAKKTTEPPLLVPSLESLAADLDRQAVPDDAAADFRAETARMANDFTTAANGARGYEPSDSNLAKGIMFSEIQALLPDFKSLEELGATGCTFVRTSS